ncbi:efflux transporter outer membrane subunit [Pseudomonas sp. Au-Pse12]|uniref:efflux transporter outer membrane subunit n=1 Tax=Pseudomonas sp. Au-Pse12 TaxID=2906459 RepID=UPI001E479825|nr:TolC family protein [Pseudomonas sp. Au-Pse12]MCE4052262.1 TolC family protein [Pseudomonas sp. Au-Pse12]
MRYTLIHALPPLCGLLLLTGLVGCTVGPDYQPRVEAPLELSQPLDPALYASEQLQRDWWRQFQDPQLDQLIEQALTRNRDIHQAQARLLEARAELDQRQLDRLPTVTAEAGYSRSLAQDNPGPAGERNLARNYRAGLDAQWEIDLFGRLQRLSQAAAARGEAAQADLAQARIVVAAEVARNYFEMRGAQRQLDVARAALENQKTMVHVVAAKVMAGRGAADELASAEAEQAHQQAALPPLETRCQLARYRLAVLVAARPNELQALNRPSTLAPLVTRLPIGDLGDLLRQRPDVASAERHFAASTADIGAVTAELYPRVDLGGFLGFVAIRGADLGTDASRAFSIMPGVSWPALHLASVKARQRQAQARQQGAQAHYEQVVLQAVAETEGALTTYSQSQQQLGDLLQAARLSARAASLAQVRYEAGAAPYLLALQAQRRRLQTEDALAQADTASYVNVVALYKALGGGWHATAMTASPGVAARH